MAMRTKKRRMPKALRNRMKEQALIQARETPDVSEGMEYKVSLDTDGEHLELFTKQPYTALLASQALSDKLQVDSYVSLGSRIVASESPKRRRR